MENEGEYRFLLKLDNEKFVFHAFVSKTFTKITISQKLKNLTGSLFLKFLYKSQSQFQKITYLLYHFTLSGNLLKCKTFNTSPESSFKFINILKNTNEFEN